MITAIRLWALMMVVFSNTSTGLAFFNLGAPASPHNPVGSYKNSAVYERLKLGKSSCGPCGQRRLRRCLMSGSFRTEIEIPRWPMHVQLDYTDSFVLLGSCFSDSIGSRLSQVKLRTAVNPSHGIVFSPLSVCESLDKMVDNEPYRRDDTGIVFSEGKGLWSSLGHHSTFDSPSRYAHVYYQLVSRLWEMRSYCRCYSSRESTKVGTYLRFLQCAEENSSHKGKLDGSASVWLDFCTTRASLEGWPHIR